ncbi:MAG TPA: N-formylglutamate deformylase [Steroidobacteraceae bacterium]|jgi:formiminoglutamase
MSAILQWLILKRGTAPLVLCVPHAGIELPPPYSSRFLSPWLARKDTDWWVDRLYDFGAELGATVVRTAISRSVIDMNRDPSGRSLYPGQATTELCPTTTFDGEPLYSPADASGHNSGAPDDEEIAARRQTFFEPYHRAVADEVARLRSAFGRVVVYDCHSIRSRIPRLFAGTLPHFNVGTHGGVSCAAELASTVDGLCEASGPSRVTNGRFRGGYTTRHYGRPSEGVHAIQMELACRGYMEEPEAVSAENWPTGYDEKRAASLRRTLRQVLEACIGFASAGGP